MGVLYNSIPSSSVTLSGAVVGAVSPQKGDAITGRTIVQKMLTQSATADTRYVVFTPTAGKILYVTHVSVIANGTVSFGKFGDNVPADTPASTTVTDSCIPWGITGAPPTVGQTFVFDQPLKCTTNFSFSSDQNTTVLIGIVGWEE